MDKEKFSLLSNIKYPEDLRKLSIDELPEPDTRVSSSLATTSCQAT